jgi:uncharacterized membrane protein
MVLALLIGIVDGLRSSTAPAVVAWAAHRNWLNLHDSSLSFTGSTVAVGVFTILALAELIADKLPSTPKRTASRGLISRIALGGLSGAAVAAAGLQSIPLGAGFGAAGGLVGAFGGYEVRTRLVRALKVPDFFIACSEDAIAIGGGLLIVSSFR